MNAEQALLDWEIREALLNRVKRLIYGGSTPTELVIATRFEMALRRLIQQYEAELEKREGAE